MFINTLPLFLEYSHIASIELLIVLGCLFGVLFISSPFPDGSLVFSDCTDFGLYQYLLKAWNGDLLLSFIFWPLFLVLNGALYGADTMVKSGMISVSSWGNIHMMVAGPVIWWTVAVWRGSARTGSRLWSTGARLAVLCVYAEFGLRLYLRQEYPRAFFNCEDVLLDYFSCF